MSNTAQLYNTLVPVEKEQHQNWSMDSTEGFAFIKNAHTSPLSAVEFFLAAQDYSIAFVDNEGVLSSIAILGMRTGENKFVLKNNDWQANTYIPALVRAYPFKLLKTEPQTSLCLHVDESHGYLNQEGKGTPFFDESGGRSELLQRATAFLQGFQEHIEFSERFCKSIKTLDIFEPLESNFKSPDGKESPTKTYLIVNRDKLNALPVETLGELAKSGYLEPIYLHLNSLSNLNELISKTRSTRR